MKRTPDPSTNSFPWALVDFGGGMGWERLWVKVKGPTTPPITQL